jgi:ribosomal protein S3AE
LKKEVEAKVAATDFGKFITEALYGRLGAELSYKLKRIAPIRRIEIKKTQLKEEFDTESVEKVEGAEAESSKTS